MKFQEAHNKLKAIAAGKFCQMKYALITHADGQLISECSLYIDGLAKIFSGATWDAAFHELNKTMHPEQFVEEMPEVEG